MRRNQSFNLSIDTNAVSPVIGSILMLVLVFLLMSIASTAILSQFESAPDPPEAQVDFDQRPDDKIEQTTRIEMTLIEKYNSQKVYIEHQNNSVNLHDESNGPYFGYYNTTQRTVCQDDESATPPGCDTGTKDVTVTKIETPSDPQYKPENTNLTTNGQKLRIYNLSDQSNLLIIAENDYGTRTISSYTIRYYEDPE